jgi:hypothetical protein
LSWTTFTTVVSVKILFFPLFVDIKEGALKHHPNSLLKKSISCLSLPRRIFFCLTGLWHDLYICWVKSS